MQYTKYNSITYLRKGLNKKSGRNATGQITIRHRGGGHKQAFRRLDWKRLNTNSLIIGFEYDPQRNAPLAKLYNDDNTISYILAPEGSKLFQKICRYNQQKEEYNSKKTFKYIKSGDKAPLIFFETGDFIHSVESFAEQGSIFARSAGSFCQIISSSAKILNIFDSKDKKIYITVRMPSKKKRIINGAAYATIGIVSTKNKNIPNLKKAGRTRWRGWRPSVRGVAMNPVDHPHGGGQGKTSGGRPSVTFKSWPTKGQPTRNPKRNKNFILH